MIQVPSLSDFNLQYTLPALSIVVWAAALLIIDLFIPRERKQTTAWLAAGGLVFAFVANAFLFNVNDEAFLGMFRADQFTAYLNAVVLGAAFIGVLMSVDYVKRAQIERGEYYVLLLFSVAGMMFMSAANDLIVVFVALELLSIPLYVLSAFRAPDTKAEESGLKYFILGAFASAFLVYGAALIYGATGTTNIPAIFDAVSGIEIGGTASILLLLGSGLMLVGLGFKVAAVPFHMWTPDVYEGAPTPITAFMSVGAKVGGFAALFRILASALPAFIFADASIHAVWQTSVWILAAATLILGNLVAISQSNIKRMLAYSSIAHAGYILMAVAAAGTTGVADEAARSALFYLLAYMFTNMGAFAIAIALEKDDGTGTNISDFTGLARSRPGLAAMMAFFMLSLTGFPPTAGFVAKFLVFQQTLAAGLVPLAIIGVLTSVVSGYYYLNIVVKMFLGDGEGEPAEGATPYLRWAAYACFAGTLILFVLPVLGTDIASSVSLATALVP